MNEEITMGQQSEEMPSRIQVVRVFGKREFIDLYTDYVADKVKSEKQKEIKTVSRIIK